MIQKKPTKEKIDKYQADSGYSRLSDYPTRIFKGHELFETKPNFCGDYKHVRFLDPNVKDKIDSSKYYKCWYSYSDASDPADSNEYFFFVYVEEVPDDIVDAINAQEKIKRYLNEK